jgi:hypothetical protein
MLREPVVSIRYSYRRTEKVCAKVLCVLNLVQITLCNNTVTFELRAIMLPFIVFRSGLTEEREKVLAVFGTFRI